MIQPIRVSSASIQFEKHLKITLKTKTFKKIYFVRFYWIWYTKVHFEYYGMGWLGWGRPNNSGGWGRRGSDFLFQRKISRRSPFIWGLREHFYGVRQHKKEKLRMEGERCFMVLWTAFWHILTYTKRPFTINYSHNVYALSSINLAPALNVNLHMYREGRIFL